MLKELKNVKTLINDLVEQAVSKSKGTDIYQVTGVNDDLTCNIKQLNSNLAYINVEMIGLGLGHGKGQIKMPETNDIVLVGFIMNSETPIILGTMFNGQMSYPDVKPGIKANEYFINNRLNGAYIYINEDDGIILRTPNGSRLRLDDNGNFKILNKDGYGISVDSSGNMLLSGITIKHTQTPLTW